MDTEIEKDRLTADRIIELENLLFAKGQMISAPCFCCGYNGPNYYQPQVHPCAKRHYERYYRSI